MSTTIKLEGEGILAPVLCADNQCIHNMGDGCFGVCSSQEKPKIENAVYVSTCRHRHPRIIKDDGNKTESGLLEEE